MIHTTEFMYVTALFGHAQEMLRQKSESRSILKEKMVPRRDCFLKNKQE